MKISKIIANQDYIQDQISYSQQVSEDKNFLKNQEQNNYDLGLESPNSTFLFKNFNYGTTQTQASNSPGRQVPDIILNSQLQTDSVQESRRKCLTPKKVYGTDNKSLIQQLKNSQIPNRNSLLVDDEDATDGIMDAIKKNFLKAKYYGMMESIRKKMVYLLNQTEIRKFKTLQKRHYEIINDRSIVVEDIQKSYTIIERIHMFMAYLDYQISRCFRKIKTSHPMSTFNLYIQILEVIVIMVNMVSFSLFIFFEFYIQNYFFYLNSISILVYLLGMLKRANTAFVDQGIVIYSREKILRRYRNGLFIYDLLPLVSMIYMGSVQNNNLLTKLMVLPIFLKSKVQSVIFENIEESLNLSGNMVHVWTLFLLLGQSLALCHFVGTFYFFVAFIEKEFLNIEENWVEIAGLWDVDPLIQYLQSYYWALATIMLIGSKGETNLETIYCIVVLVCTVGMFAKILSSVALVMEQMEELQKMYKKDKEILNTFFSIHEISHDLQEGHKEKGANQDFESLMQNKFPDDLQDMVRDERYNTQIDKFTLLGDNFSPSSAAKLLKYVEEEYYMPNQIIFQRDVYEEPKIYLILSGQVEIYQETGEIDSVIRTLQPGEYFGENTFFTDSIPFYSVRSTEDQFTTVLVISRTQFLEIIQENEQDNEKYQTIKDQMLIHGYTNIINPACCICHGNNHGEEKCALLNYAPNKLNMAYKLNYSKDNIRQKLPIQQKQEQQNILIQRKLLKIHCISGIHSIIEKSFDILESSELRKFVKVIQETQKYMTDKLAADYDEEDDEEESEIEYEENDNDSIIANKLIHDSDEIENKKQNTQARKSIRKKTYSIKKKNTKVIKKVSIKNMDKIENLLSQAKQQEKSNDNNSDSNDSQISFNSQCMLNLNTNKKQKIQFTNTINNYDTPLQVNDHIDHHSLMHFEEFDIDIHHIHNKKQKQKLLKNYSQIKEQNQNKGSEEDEFYHKTQKSILRQKSRNSYSQFDLNNNQINTEIIQKLNNIEKIIQNNNSIKQNNTQNAMSHGLNRHKQSILQLQSQKDLYKSQNNNFKLDFNIQNNNSDLFNNKQNNIQEIGLKSVQSEYKLSKREDYFQHEDIYEENDFEKELKQFFIVKDMDKMQSFQHYFIHNNYMETIRSQRKKQKKYLKQQLKNKTKKKINKTVKKLFAF